MNQDLINQKIDRLLIELFLEVPVIIGFIQKDKRQKEYGCCYYPFWRKVKDPLLPQPDFVNARWQELAYTLAFLYKMSFPGNIYYQNPSLPCLIKSVLLYWGHIQNRDGSFSEWLKDGHEYPPTAFGLWRMVETYKLCSEIFQASERKVIEDSFHNSGFWLMRHNHLMAINHECGGLAALASLFSLCKSPDYKQAIDKKIALILKYQDKEGWFREIDGPDTGYNTASITQLALAYQYYPSERLKKIIKRALAFNSYFIYPDGMMGGGMNSRFAMNLDPLGFAMFGSEFHLARAMAFSCLNGFVEGKIRGTYNSSDYQRCSMLGHMFLFCWWLYKISKNYDFKQDRKRLPAQDHKNINYRFNNMGTAIVKTPLFYLASGPGAALGAIYSYKAKETLIYSSPYEIINNSGIYIDNGKNIYYSSNRGNSIKTKWGDNFQICEGRLVPVGKDVPDRWHHPGVGGIVKKKLRKHFPEIYDRLNRLNQIKAKWKKGVNLIRQGICFRRELFWEEGRLLVKNEVWYNTMSHLIIRENIRISRYGDKDYKLIFDEQDIVLIDRNPDLKYNHITNVSLIKKEEGPVLKFVFSEPVAIRILGQGEKNTFSDMNAWGLAIEMSPEIRNLDYYIYF